MAENSACADGSRSVSRRLWARATTSPSHTTTAPMGTSPSSAAARASSSAMRMKRSSSLVPATAPPSPLDGIHMG